MSRFASCRAFAASVVVAAALSTTSIAQALPLTWNVTGVFDDGGTVTGQFTIDVYGYYDEPTALITGGSLIGPFTYSLALPQQIIPPTPPAFGVVFYSEYSDRALQIMFLNSLEIGSANNPIDLSASASFECLSYTCPGPGTPDADANTRFFVSGFASVAQAATPLPAALPMFATGLAGLGWLARRRRKQAA